jgi:hypothetical protein
VSPVAVPITNGTPGAAVVPTPALSGDESTIGGISCSDAGDCSVSGSNLNAEPPSLTPLVGAETGGSWGPLSPLPLTSGASIALTTSLSCASAGVCLTTGFEESASDVVTATTFFANSTPPLSATTTSLPAATVGRPYSAMLQSSGGSGTTSWALTAGTLPEGLSLDGSTGVISGTPTTVGNDGFVVTVSSTPPRQNAAASLSITVSPAPPALPPSPPPLASTVGITHVTTSGAKAKVTLECSGAACTGALKLTGVEHLIGKTPTAIATSTGGKKKKARRRTKTITLASGSYSLVAGATKTVTLTLSKGAVKLLTKLHTVHGKLTATPTGAQPPVTKTVTFKAKTSRHNKKHKK